MPEETIVQPAAPAPAEAPKLTGIDAMMAQLDSAAASGSNLPEAAKPETETPPPAKPEPAKKADVPANDPLKPAPVAAKPEAEMSVEEMEKFLKAHSNKKPWKVYESLKTTTAQKVAELEGKLSALEKKPVEAPGDAAKMAALEKQIEALSGETKTYKEKLAASEYIHTPKYEELRAKANRLWSKAVQTVVGMTVTDGDGNTRAATKEDFDFIRLLPPAKRRTAARETFGDDAIEVLGFVNQLESVREENDEAAEAFTKTHEQSALQRDLQAKGERAKFDASYKASLEQMRKNEVWGKWFSPDEADPEATKLLNDGFSEVERVVQQADQMTPEDAAAHAAVYRARAAAMPRVLLEVSRLTTKMKALETELAQYRGTDPGAKGATAGGGESASDKPKGIDAVARSFDDDPSLIRR